MDDLDLGYLLAVAGAAAWAPRPLASWFRALGSARAIVERVRAQDGAPPQGAEPLSFEALARLAALDDAAAARALGEARAADARIVLRDDAAYPARLRDLCDAPLVLYCRGDLAVLEGRCIAIVGSRAATSYGRSVAAAMASDCAAFGVTVISGLARGVDAAAHRGALEANVSTVAVLGSGVCALYPPYHALLADEIVAAGGAVLSEFPPGTTARAHQFPMRNRVVAALADATVVVEASTRSGALITARLADELGRNVYAIPGDVMRPTSCGTNALIADGVPLVTSVADVAALQNWECRVPTELCSAGALAPENGTVNLLALLGGGAGVDELSAQTGIPAADLAAQLTLLELQGVVERQPGGVYAAVRARAASKAAPG
jgi:DNA processing protein